MLKRTLRTHGEYMKGGQVVTALLALSGLVQPGSSLSLDSVCPDLADLLPLDLAHALWGFGALALYPGKEKTDTLLKKVTASILQIGPSQAHDIL
ncbi:hypothetical protein WJX73_003613 [Symbiochloris irregularis]|uniref:Uncharacterized protein n=1 Tax=Symbiochloris irregularis TaxID=706552 RepID=A0AAW1P1S9_9CHLO